MRKPLLNSATVKPFVDTVADLLKGAEEALEPGSVLLKGFSRPIQLDTYSCGAQCAFAVLKYYGKARSIKNVTKVLGTDEDGTTYMQLEDLFTKRGLRPAILRAPTIRKLKDEIDEGFPVILGMDGSRRSTGNHWAVLYGYGPGCLFVVDPAPNRSPFCKHSVERFNSRWRKWAMSVRE